MEYCTALGRLLVKISMLVVFLCTAFATSCFWKSDEDIRFWASSCGWVVERLDWRLSAGLFGVLVIERDGWDFGCIYIAEQVFVWL